MSREWNAALAVLITLLLLRSSGTPIDAAVLIGAALGVLVLVAWPRLFPRRAPSPPQEPGLIDYSVRSTSRRVRWLIYRGSASEGPMRARYEAERGEIWDTEAVDAALLEEGTGR